MSRYELLVRLDALWAKIHHFRAGHSDEYISGGIRAALVTEERADFGSLGGEGRAEQLKDAAKADADAIRDAATALLKDGRSPRAISSVLMQRARGNRPKILRALKSHSSGLWSKRNKK